MSRRTREESGMGLWACGSFAHGGGARWRRIYHETGDAECNIYATNFDLTNGEKCARPDIAGAGDAGPPNADASPLRASAWCAEAQSGEIGINDIQSSSSRPRSGQRERSAVRYGFTAISRTARGSGTRGSGRSQYTRRNEK